LKEGYTTGTSDPNDIINEAIQTMVASAVAQAVPLAVTAALQSYVPGPGELAVTFDSPLQVNLEIYFSEGPRRAIKAILTIGERMPGSITVDTTNETAVVDFVDDHGNVTSAPAGAVVTFSSDNTAVATIATDPTNPLQGDVTPVAPGTANIGATIADASGNPILEPDGVTPFAVTSVAVTVSPGPAAGADLVLSV
jgi:hypothetical protein